MDLTRINVEFIAEPKGGTTTGQSASSTGKMRLGDIAKNVLGDTFIVNNVHEVIYSFKKFSSQLEVDMSGSACVRKGRNVKPLMEAKITFKK